MFKWLLIILCLCRANTLEAQQELLHKLHTGDLLFQNLDCGPLCDAIEAVTDGFDGHDFSHIGMVYIQNDSIYIIEAIGSNVHLTPLDDFLNRSANKVYAATVKTQYRNIAHNAAAYARQQCGIPYDDAFLYNNGKYYCSELIYDAFKKANHNKPFFQLHPMTFKIPGKTVFFPVWVNYYKQLGMPIPEGEAGINPGGISKSNKLIILNR